MAVPDRARRPPPLLLLLLLGLAHGASAVFVVKDSNGTACIMANFSAHFWTSYETELGSQNASVYLPPSAEVLNSSSCGGNSSDPSLTIAFGRGYSLTLNFTRNATRYQVQVMRFTYNMSDTETFPNASAKGSKSEESITDIRADIDKKYRCVSGTMVHMNDVVILLWDATIQAYLSNSSFSQGETRCRQDIPSPTTAPPAPTTAPPSPTPTAEPTSPSVSRYNVSGANGTCLLASMGLQLNFTYTRKDNMTVIRVLNLNPNHTKAVGSCGPYHVALTLLSEEDFFLTLKFGMNTSASRFFLEGVQLNMTLPDAKDPSFQAANSSLRALQASVGNSYRCNTEERLYVTQAFSLNIFSVWVQAFKVDGDTFGSVEECLLDGNNMLIPIAVGGALAGLVLIVLIAYLIGRKRSHAGYQTI
ncbi:lysosome-associated membrane glycoprotein 1 isoform X2 [Perognathus longimembris pacificus]|uniref:lysosome-associated membrane glycoprotein 1 isoform X2 n=1 Tax=Perognathus longimembris pacificus TaxID=214514 RepID=UPI002018CC6D|nr:lysosome-associated membrane glycoprotein 1 isoform X2 [Perognathus longimembris pacificus]